MKTPMLVSLILAGEILQIPALEKKPERSPSHHQMMNSNCKNPMRVSFYGDIYINRNRAFPSKDLFRNVQSLLDWSPFNVANFEGVVSEFQTRSFPSYPFALKIDKDVPDILRAVGINYVTLANNHLMDFGVVGMMDTFAALKKAGIEFTGAGENREASSVPLILSDGTTRVAVLAYALTYPVEAWASSKRSGVSPALTDFIREDITKARLKSDFVVVTFHWGEESSTTLRSYQPELSRLTLNSGADLIIGHHPHVAQGVSISNGHTTSFSLGNFLFTSFSEQAGLSLSAHVEFCKEEKTAEKKVQVAFVPLDTLNRRTNFATTPVSSKSFVKSLGDLYDFRKISGETLFYFPDEKQTLKFHDFLKFKN